MRVKLMKNVSIMCIIVAMGACSGDDKSDKLMGVGVNCSDSVIKRENVGNKVCADFTIVE